MGVPALRGRSIHRISSLRRYSAIKTHWQSKNQFSPMESPWIYQPYFWAGCIMFRDIWPMQNKLNSIFVDFLKICFIFGLLLVYFNFFFCCFLFVNFHSVLWLRGGEDSMSNRKGKHDQNILSLIEKDACVFRILGNREEEGRTEHGLGSKLLNSLSHLTGSSPFVVFGNNSHTNTCNGIRCPLLA